MVHQDTSNRISSHATRTVEAWILLAGMLVYLGIMGWASVLRHQRFASYAYDLGIYDQALWLLSRGHRPWISVRELHMLGDHFTPILYPLAALYRLPYSTELLLLFQTAALTVGAVPIYRMGSRYTGTPTAGMIAGILYLIYPPLWGINLFDFHPIALAIPGVLFALDFLSSRRALPFVITCLLIALCKQEAVIVVGCLGVLYAVRWRQAKALLLCAAAGIWFLTALRLQAHFAGTESSAYYSLYGQFGASPKEVVSTLLLKPSVTLAWLGQAEAFVYLTTLMLPLAFLSILSLDILWIAVLPLLLNLFSNRPAMRAINYQYTALLTPALFAAAATTCARITSPSSRRVVGIAWVACAVTAALLLAHTIYEPVTQRVISAEEAAQIRQVLATIPPTSSVCATQSLVPHLAQRVKIHLFPNPFWPLATGPNSSALAQQLGKEHPPLNSGVLQQALSNSDLDYLVLGYRLDLRCGSFPVLSSQHAPLLAEALRNPHYGVISSKAGIWLLKRGAAHAAGLKTLGLSPTDSPSQFVDRVRALCTAKS